MFVIDNECKKPPCKENEYYRAYKVVKNCKKCEGNKIHNDIGTECECKGKNDGAHFKNENCDECKENYYPKNECKKLCDNTKKETLGMFLIDDECKKSSCWYDRFYNPVSKECTKCYDPKSIECT